MTRRGDVEILPSGQTIEDMADAIVPCETCTLCCKNQHVFLQPGERYNADAVDYAHHPVTGEWSPKLKNKPNGDCVFLEDEKCTIYAIRPKMCRVFDCRAFAMNMSAAVRRARINRGDKITARGKELMKAQRRMLRDCPT